MANISIFNAILRKNFLISIGGIFWVLSRGFNDCGWFGARVVRLFPLFSPDFLNLPLSGGQFGLNAVVGLSQIFHVVLDHGNTSIGVH
jgi:hypothetical protein